MDTAAPTPDVAATEDRAAEMRDRLDSQKAAFQQDGPVSAKLRKDRIERALAILVDNKDALAQAMDADFSGRPALMSQFTDIAASVKSLKYAKNHLDRWMRPERRPVELQFKVLGAKSWVEYQPKGVVGVVSPWNFPVNLTFSPLAGIFAAGNRAMIKPSEFTPATSESMAKLFADHFDQDEVAVFTGGPEVGRAFTALPFDHLLFTGATAIGRHVMRAAADNLTPVTLELGGKSPVVVSRSADMGMLARRIVTGKMLNAGQICLAPDYLLVPRETEDGLIHLLTETAKDIYGDPVGNPDYTAIVSDKHKTRLEGYLVDAKAKGAELITIGGDRDGDGRQMPLTLVRNVTDEMAVMKEEIFGPILPIVPYDNIHDAIAYIDARPRPLGLYYFGEDRAEERLVLEQTHSGGVTINDTIFHTAQEQLPFGGIGASGMGVYHGHDGFKTFSHARAVFRQTNKNLLKLIGALPPYGDRLEAVLKTQIRK